MPDQRACEPGRSHVSGGVRVSLLWGHVSSTHGAAEMRTQLRWQPQSERSQAKGHMIRVDKKGVKHLDPAGYQFHLRPQDRDASQSQPDTADSQRPPPVGGRGAQGPCALRRRPSGGPGLWKLPDRAPFLSFCRKPVPSPPVTLGSLSFKTQFSSKLFQHILRLSFRGRHPQVLPWAPVAPKSLQITQSPPID